MSANLKTLLTQAAEYRAAGQQWSYIARQVNRKTRTCQNWPTRYPAQWRAVYNEAQANRFEQLASEGYTHLTNLLRNPNPKISAIGVGLLLKHAAQAYGPNGTMRIEPVAPPSANDTIRERFIRLADQARAEVDRQRRAAGLGPANDAEFMAAWKAHTEAEARTEPIPVYFDEEGNSCAPPGEKDEPAEEEQEAEERPEAATMPAVPAGPAFGARDMLWGALLLAVLIVERVPRSEPGPEAPALAGLREERLKTELPRPARDAWVRLAQADPDSLPRSDRLRPDGERTESAGRSPTRSVATTLPPRFAWEAGPEPRRARLRPERGRIESVRLSPTRSVATTLPPRSAWEAGRSHEVRPDAPATAVAARPNGAVQDATTHRPFGVALADPFLAPVDVRPHHPLSFQGLPDEAGCETWGRRSGRAPREESTAQQLAGAVRIRDNREGGAASTAGPARFTPLPFGDADPTCDMIPSAVNMVLVVFGLGMLALAAGTWLRAAPSAGRFEKVVTFAAIGLVAVAVGTALVCKDLIGPRKDNLGETIVVATAFGCLGFCVVGYPLLHWLAVRRRGRRPPASQDFAEDRRGNPIQSEDPPARSDW